MNYLESTTLLNKITNGRYLYSIWSPRSNVGIYFQSTLTDSSYQYRRIVENIKVKNIDIGNIFLQVDLEYYSDYQRFFLTKATFNNNPTSSASYSYMMSYNDPGGLPDRFAFSQDHLGYFNGKNNQTLLPKNISTNFEEINSYLADREPDFTYASKGTLDTLYYPTGGYTYFEYEAPSTGICQSNSRAFLETYCNYQGLIPDTKLEDNVFIAPEVDEYGNPINDILDQQINVHVNVTSSEDVNHHYIIYVKVQDLEYLTDTVCSFNLLPGDTLRSADFLFNFEKDACYRVSLELDPNSQYTSDPCFVYVNAYFDYLAESNVADNGLGIRIKRVYDYPSASAEPIIKRYYYKQAKDILESAKSSSAIPSSGSYYYLRQNRFNLPHIVNGLICYHL